MKVLLVSGHAKDWHAGASTVYLHLHQALEQAGQPCDLYHREDYVPARTPGAVLKFTQAGALRRRLERAARAADVIEVAGNLGGPLFAALRRLRPQQRPLLVTRLHGLEFLDEQARVTEEIAGHVKLPLKYRLLTRHVTNRQEFRTLALCDRVICYTSRDVDALITAGLKPETHISQMPPGVEPRFLDAFAERVHAPARRRLLWWGSWVERKGIATLPRAFALACRATADLTLTIGGTGAPAAVVLEQFAPEVRARVTVLPFLTPDQHLATLREHDIFLFPSLSEGFGLALLEAMATGLPCITTLTGMAYDHLEHGRDAILVPMNAPTALARAITALCPDSERRRALGEGAHRTALTLTWPALAHRTLDVYRESLALLRRREADPSATSSPLSGSGAMPSTAERRS